MECANCFTAYTPSWRTIGQIKYCNACAIHYKKYGIHKNVPEYYAGILLKLKKAPQVSFF
jgi:hypothetical protein